MTSMHREFYGYSHSEVRIKLENNFHRLMALDSNWKQKVGMLRDDQYSDIFLT